jgi:fructose-1,6-bisphosphatase I
LAALEERGGLCERILFRAGKPFGVGDRFGLCEELNAPRPTGIEYLHVDQNPNSTNPGALRMATNTNTPAPSIELGLFSLSQADSPETPGDHLLRLNPDADPALAAALDATAEAAVEIQKHVATIGLNALDAETGGRNSRNDCVKRMDQLCHEVLAEAFLRCGTIADMLSEEAATPVNLANRSARRYDARVDPMDGSKGLGACATVGTIAAFNRSGAGLGPGREQAAAVYVVYGSSTEYVYTAGPKFGTHVFTYDPTYRSFRLTVEHLLLKPHGKIYLVNRAYEAGFAPEVRDFLSMLDGGRLDGRQYGQRYDGSLVGDGHRVLRQSGIFLYPGDNKLSLLYEAFPLALICEAAGGLATDGVARILDRTPRYWHETSPFFFGSRDEMLALAVCMRR